ncbi:MAG: lysophospholipid acyltransferase family protein [Acidiferrobacterales bacterium]|nr:lysophospholipid acyltransferase family protein [Acidiferrobacterales bacterium]
MIGLTCRIKWNDKDKFEELTDSGKASILSFWHENVLIIPYILRNRGFTCMVSESRDGEYIARSGAVFGNFTIRGGSSSGSAKATRAALRLLKQNKPLAITPDGPRGPAHKLQSGVLWLGALSSAPIVPFHIEATSQWRFKSWDGQKIPKPFSTIYVEVGEPYCLSREKLEDQVAEVTQELETRMMANVQAVQKRAGTN